MHHWRTKKIQGNQTPFMAKELSKQIMKRSKSKNLYFKWPSRKNLLIYKNEKNIWNYMTKYAENRFFEN